MKKEDYNPRAFATANESSHQPGMTLLDYFAGQAMQGMCAYHNTEGIFNTGTTAQRAYEVAQEMLKERQKYFNNKINKL